MAQSTYNVDNGQMEGGKLPQFDYDSQEFYDAIEKLAKNGANDAEIAAGLKHLIGVSLSPQNFNSIKGGKYAFWTDEENARRGRRMQEILANARLDTNRLVKSVYLSTALGKNVTKTTTTVRKRLRINGELTDNEEIQTTEVVNGISPNLSALQTWLYHHDPEWRKITKGEDYETGDGVPTGDQVKKGVDISAWINKEMDASKEEEV